MTNISLGVILSFLFEIFLTVWFFRSDYKNTESRLHRILSIIPLFGLFPLILSADYIGSMLIRFFYRWLLIFLMLVILYAGKAVRSLYLSGLCSITFAAQQNILIISKIASQDWTDDAVLRFGIIVPLEYVLPFVIITLVSGCINFSRIKAFKGHQIIVLALLLPSVLYSKISFFATVRGQSLTFTLLNFTYPMIISVLALIIIANYDRFWQMREDREEQLVLDVARQIQYKELQAQIAAQEDNRAIIHDFRNHLLALSDTDSATKKEHIDELLERIDIAGLTADTGNETLDAILVQKQRDAIKDKIRMIADLNLRKAAALAPMDTISIFANALDNALEAAREVPADEDRYIRIRGGLVASLYIIRITNSTAAVTTVDNNGLLHTHKSDTVHHGVGMKSMRRTLNKLGGSMSFQQEDGCFTLTISLPAAG